MLRYTGKMEYNEAAVFKLTETQYNMFQADKKIRLMVLSVILLFAGFGIGMKSAFGIACIFVGCVLITGRNTRPRALAKQFISELNGSYPVFSYIFTDTGFKTQTEQAEIKYSSIICLVLDKDYIYIYVSPEKTYMIEVKSIKPENGNADFQSFLTKQTGLPWSSALTLFNFNYRKMKDAILRSRIK